MLLYTDEAHRRSWLYGILALLIFAFNYFGYPYRYGLDSGWNSWLEVIYGGLTVVVVYFGFAAVNVTASSLRLILLVFVAGMGYVVVTKSYELLIINENFTAIPVGYVLGSAATIIVATLFSAIFEGLLWSWRDPRKRF